jgi:organic radical activating enzyme
VQGEGPSLGQRCAFLRLGGCNLSCRWCDTPYTWDWTGKSDTGVAYDPRRELHPMRADDVVQRLAAYRVPLVVVSGGEPLNQQRRLVPVVERLGALGVRVEIETNGTIAPCAELTRPGVRFNVSPKLAHAGDPLSRRLRPDALRALSRTDGVAFKFVCASKADLDEVLELEQRFGLAPIWIMPLGRDAREIARSLAAVADAAIGNGWNLTTRLHVLAWNDQRGR